VPSERSLLSAAASSDDRGVEQSLRPQSPEEFVGQKSLLRKLHFTNRTQAAIWAVGHFGSRAAASGLSQPAR